MKINLGIEGTAKYIRTRELIELGATHQMIAAGITGDRTCLEPGVDLIEYCKKLVEENGGDVDMGSLMEMGNQTIIIRGVSAKFAYPSVVDSMRLKERTKEILTEKYRDNKFIIKDDD